MNGDTGGDATRLGVVGVGWLFSIASPEDIVSYLTILFILYQGVMYSPRVYAALRFWYRKLKGQSPGDGTGDDNDGMDIK